MNAIAKASLRANTKHPLTSLFLKRFDIAGQRRGCEGHLTGGRVGANPVERDRPRRLR